MTANIARMLGSSRAKALAERDIDEERERRRAIDARLGWLLGEHAGTSRFRRGRRAELELQIDARRRELRAPLPAAAPQIERPSAPRPGRDPFAGLERVRDRAHERDVGREL